MVQGVAIQDGCIVNTNPATGEIISHVPTTPLLEIDGMVLKAQKAQLKWSELPIQKRIECLRKGLANLSSEQSSIAKLMVQEMGKPLAEAEEEMEEAVDKDDYLDILEESLQSKTHGTSVIVRQALGVVVVIPPWNYPVDEILLLALPALGSGNTVIVKPSEVTPECGARTVAALRSALPHWDILQLCQGDGLVGAELVKHSHIDMVAMTGSSKTGRFILEQASKTNMKRLVLELGGKDPMIVFDDADLEKAAHDGVKYSLSNAGQVCCSTERIYVQESIRSKFEEYVLSEVSNYKVGNGLTPNVNVGPLVSPLQKERVSTQVSQAVQEGAKILYQSDIPTPEAEHIANGGGNFYPVTVLTDVTPSMDISKEETFGPVVCVSTFDGTEEQAILLANDTPYGLASSVYSQDLKKAQRVANRIKAGQVGINCYSLENMDVHCPWVGHKCSGFGYHSGVDGFHQFSIPKTLVFTPEEEGGDDNCDT